MKINIFQMKIFQKITLFLFLIYSFVAQNVLVSLPKSFHGPFDNENALPLAHWPFYWSIGIIQPVLNETWLFTIY